MVRANRRRCRRGRISTGGRETQSAKRKPAGAGSGRASSHRHPVLRFLLVFGVLMGAFYIVTIFTPFYRNRLFPVCLRLTAKLAGAVLACLGQDTVVTGTSIATPQFSATVVRGCDAVEPVALFVCAVLAFPSSLVSKLPGIIAGVLLLTLLNLVRLASLFLIGVYVPSMLRIMHVDVWQGVFIVLALMLWLLWLLWANHSQMPAAQASS